MDDTGKVIICLGFFTLVGFVAYLLYSSYTGGGLVTISGGGNDWVTVADLKKAQHDEERSYNAR